jgi:hypothetical protein
MARRKRRSRGSICIHEYCSDLECLISSFHACLRYYLTCRNSCVGGSHGSPARDHAAFTLTSYVLVDNSYRVVAANLSVLNFSVLYQPRLKLLNYQSPRRRHGDNTQNVSPKTVDRVRTGDSKSTQSLFSNAKLQFNVMLVPRMLFRALLAHVIMRLAFHYYFPLYAHTLTSVPSRHGCLFTSLLTR